MNKMEGRQADNSEEMAEVPTADNGTFLTTERRGRPVRVRDVQHKTPVRTCFDRLRCHGHLFKAAHILHDGSLGSRQRDITNNSKGRKVHNAGAQMTM